MSDGSAKVRFFFGDGEHDFRLALAELMELQDHTGIGPWELADRLQTKRCRVQDVLQTLRLGLKGGGMAPDAAFALVSRYGENRPLEESRIPAFVVVMAAIVGAKDDPVGEEAVLKTATETSPETGASASAPL